MVRLVELILYGIRQFQTMTRIPFGPGFNLLAGGVGTGKSTICELVVAMLFPRAAAQCRPFRHPHAPERAQAVLTFDGENGARYRLARDFSKDRVTLAKLNPHGESTAANATPIASDNTSVEAEINRLLQGLTAEQVLLRWLLTQAQLPSARSVSVNGSSAPVVAAPLSATNPATTPSPAGQPTGRAGSHLEELKRALAKAEETAALDEKLITAQDRAAAIKHKLASLAQVTEERAELEGQLEKFSGLNQLPSDYAVLIEGLAERERALQAQQDHLQEQLNTLDEERAALSSEPIFRQRWFLVGAVLTGLALLVALFINLTWPLALIFWVPLGSGLGLFSWSFYTDMKTHSQRKQLHLQAKALKMERETAEKRFAREQRPALELLTLAQCRDVAAFQERVRNYRRLKEEVEHLGEEQAHYLGGQTMEQLEQSFRQAVEESKQFEEQIRAIAMAAGHSGIGDISSLQAEIARLESATSPTPAAASPFAPPTDSAWIDLVRSRWPHDDPSLQAAIAALFAKLSGGHYTRIDWADGRLRLYTAAGQMIDPDLLSSGQRDLLALACMLAPWLSSRTEKAHMPLGRFPLLLDEPFLSLDGAGQAACLQLLRAIAPAQQVVLATRMTVGEQPADHRITLPLPPQAAETPSR